MKFKSLISLLLIFLVCFIAGGSGAENQPQPEKRVMNFIAVMNLSCGDVVNKQNCNALTDMVIEELVKIKKYTVIDRANRDKILAEMGFQQTGCVEESCTVEAGRVLGVGKIVVGNITKIGETFVVTLQLVNVETAAVEVAARERCDKCKLEDLIDTVTNAARKLMGEEPLSPTRPTPTAPPSAPAVAAKEALKGNLLAYTNCLSGDPSTYTCTNNEIIILDVEQGKRLKTIKQGLVTSIAFSPDAKYLAIGTENGEVNIFNITTDELKNLGTHSGKNNGVSAVSFGGDGDTLASYAPGAAIIWDVKNSSELKAIKYGVNPMYKMLLSPDNRYLAILGMHGLNCYIDLIDVATGNIKTKLRSGVVYAFSFSPNGEFIAYGGSDPSILVYDLKSEQNKMILKGHSKNVTGLAFSPDNKMLASAGADMKLKIWDVETGNEQRSLDNSPFTYSLYLAFSDDGKYLVSASATGTIILDNGNTVFWDTSSWQKKKSVPFNILRIGTLGSAPPRFTSGTAR